jgi:hypothetical protein
VNKPRVASAQLCTTDSRKTHAKRILHTHDARTPGQPPGSSRFSLSRAPPTSSARYVRHRPETIRLYHVVREYWPEFQAELASHGKHLPTFISRLVSLIPRPRVNLTRFHGVFAPNSKHRGLITPAKLGKGKAPPETQKTSPLERHIAITWARRLKRVFDIDIETCSQCGGAVKIIASIEDPAVIRKILTHLDKNATSAETGLLPDCRAPPRASLFEENHHPTYRLH